MELVSVVVAAFNVESFIDRALGSLRAQTHENLEILVADDGSTDGTRALIDELAKRDPRIRVLHNPRNLGVVRTRNKLFQASTGSFITLLDSDDWVAPTKIEKQVGYLRGSDVQAVGVGYCTTDFAGNVSAASDLGDKHVLERVDIFNLPFWPPSIMITRRLFDQIGGYHPYFEDFACYEDLYWMYEILDRSPIGFVAEHLYYYRQNPASLVRTLNLKRLAGRELVAALIRQRLDTGGDWLTEQEQQKADAFIARLLDDRRWVAESYRTYAAVKTDERRVSEAWSLLAKAVRTDPASLGNLRTAFYLARVAAGQLARAPA